LPGVFCNALSAANGFWHCMRAISVGLCKWVHGILVQAFSAGDLQTPV
jgi:hypothetical protein